MTVIQRGQRFTFANGASQLSDGQRQLFCAARALLRRPKILVLDESTADLDQDSANELLRVIDENFKNTTVISIAHRYESMISGNGLEYSCSDTAIAVALLY